MAVEHEQHPSVPWPHIDLPQLAWPDWSLPPWLAWVRDHARYVTPVVVAFVVARAEVRRRRRQREQREAAASAAPRPAHRPHRS